MHLRRGAVTRPLLKFHKLTVTVRETDLFDRQVVAGLENHVASRQFAACSDEDRAYLRERIGELERDPTSDLAKLRRVVDTQTLGKLKREAMIRYLEFLHASLAEARAKGVDVRVTLLEDLIRRLRLIDDYINDPGRDDGQYDVHYGGTRANYRELFSRGDAFDELPIIPLIEGSLGETTDEARGERQFIFGLKLKFNGKVAVAGKERPSVYDYYASLLDPQSERHKQGLAQTYGTDAFRQRVLKVAFLYYVVLRNAGDLNFDPIATFEEHILPILQGADGSRKVRVLHTLKQRLEEPASDVHRKLADLRELLRAHVKTTAPEKTEFPVHISVRRGILERDPTTVLTTGRFFRDVLEGDGRRALSYVTVGASRLDENALCKLPATIGIESYFFVPAAGADTFSMSYDIAGMAALPVVFAAKDDRSRAAYSRLAKDHDVVLFPYDSRILATLGTTPDSPQHFVYRFVYVLLTYICLKVLLEWARATLAGKALFVPLVRLQLTGRQDATPEELFIRAHTKVLAHLLGEDVLANAQGFDIHDLESSSLSYRLRNGLSSLYSVLPKTFRFAAPLARDAESAQLLSPSGPRLDKLALVVVSSRQCDGRARREHVVSNLIGEAIGIERADDGTIRLRTLRSFSETREKASMFQEPAVVIDEVNRLYDQGYRHILYVADSPYTSTLHLTHDVANDGLYFLSKSVIKALKGDKADIKIYPIFYDKYYAVKTATLGVNSLYIQDTSELTGLVQDPSKSAVVFFNLLNGITLPGADEDRFYNGVVSYATLLNLYEGILDDRDIRAALLYDDETHTLKGDIVNYLTLVHFARYEAVPRRGRAISFKLDPYGSVIGSESAGALSIFTHMTRGIRFNALAFLTEVRRVLNLPVPAGAAR